MRVTLSQQVLRAWMIGHKCDSLSLCESESKWQSVESQEVRKRTEKDGQRKFYQRTERYKETERLKLQDRTACKGLHFGLILKD